MSSFRRKTYGKVRPVPKPKVLAPSKPSALALQQIYKQLSVSPDSRTNDLLSEALLWWKAAIPYCQWKYKKIFPLACSKAFVAAAGYQLAGNASTKDAEKTKHFVKAIEQYARFGSSAMKVPVLAPYLKKVSGVTKKLKERDNKLADRFDSILLLLEKCFNEPSISLKVTEKLDGDVDRKWDHGIRTLYYSRAACIKMKNVLHKRGLLPLVIGEADAIARGLSLAPKVGDGSFISDAALHHENFVILLGRFEEFAHTTNCPKTLVRRDKPKKKGKV